MIYKLLTIAVLLFLMSCTSNQKKIQETCEENRTDLDGVCVRMDVADFASCIRSQSFELSEQENNKLSAEVGYLGAKVSGASELSKKLSKKYSTSDSVMMEIVNRCDRLVSNNRQNTVDTIISSNNDKNSSNTLSGTQVWNVVVSPYRSTFKFSIDKNGHFKGESFWVYRGNNVSNRIEGKISNNTINFIRYFDDAAGGKQAWMGTINLTTSTVTGNWSGTGGGGAWTATIINN